MQQQSKQTTGRSLLFAVSGETYGFPSTILKSFESFHHKNYNDEDTHVRCLQLPKDTNIIFTTTNIAGYVNACGINNVKDCLMLSFKNLFKYYTKQNVKYDVSLNTDIFKCIQNVNFTLPNKLQKTYEFKYVDGQVKFPTLDSYIISRLMIPSHSDVDLLIGQDKDLEKQFKDTYIEVYNDCLTMWVKLEISNKINQQNTQNEIKKATNFLNGTVKNIKSILYQLFNLSNDTESISYKVGYAVLFNNLPYFVDGLTSLDNQLFDIFKIDEHDEKEYVAALEQLTKYDDSLHKLLHNCLQYVLKFKKDDCYELYEYDSDVRELLFKFAVVESMGAIAERENNKRLLYLINMFSRPSPTYPYGVGEKIITELKTFPREQLLDTYFKYRIIESRKYLEAGNMFPILKRLFYDETQYRDMLFTRWSSLDYYEFNKTGEQACTPFGVFMEWCYFISDVDYTKLLFKILYKCPTDARKFLLFNIDELHTHAIINAMSNIEHIETVPSFNNPTESHIQIKQLLINMHNGVKNNTNGGYYVKPAIEEYSQKYLQTIKNLIDLY